nr:PREDICTED: transmembrane protein C5orf28 homolog [Pelecanus crispus]
MVFAMASETEKAHALLQTFSTASVVSSLGLGIFCFVADRLLQFSFVQQNDWLRAFSDNAVHGVLGMWSWAIVIGLRKKSDFTEVALAGFLASVIDVDHFFLAGSLSLKLSSTKRAFSQNHGVVVVGRVFWRSSSPSPLLKQAHVEPVAQHHVQTAFEYLQGCRLPNLSGQPVPVHSHHHRENVFPYIQEEPPVFQSVPVASCPVSGHRWK